MILVQQNFFYCAPPNKVTCINVWGFDPEPSYCQILCFKIFPHTHRCTRVENPGEGVAYIFAWGSMLSGKIAWGSPNLAVIAFLLTRFFFNLPGGGFLYHFPSSPPCVHLCAFHLPLRRVPQVGNHRPKMLLG